MFKYKFIILKYFYNEEKRLVLIIFLAFVFILVYIFTGYLPEIIPFGSELIAVAYDISIAFLIGIILYFLQIYLPKIDKRKNAQRELNIIINDLIKLVSLIIENYYSSQELWEIRFANNPNEYIYNNIDKISNYIEDNLKLDDIIKFKWNKDKKLTFHDEFVKTVNKFNMDYREIRLKYGDYLENKSLDNLERIYRNYIFINIRDSERLSQDDIKKIIFQELLQNMSGLQKTADKVNVVCKN